MNFPPKVNIDISYAYAKLALCSKPTNICMELLESDWC
jgi:hypothetical protein